MCDEAQDAYFVTTRKTFRPSSEQRERSRRVPDSKYNVVAVDALNNSPRCWPSQLRNKNGGRSPPHWSNKD